MQVNYLPFAVPVKGFHLTERSGLYGCTGTHCISILCEVLYLSLVLEFYCFLSFIYFFYVIRAPVHKKKPKDH